MTYHLFFFPFFPFFPFLGFSLGFTTSPNPHSGYLYLGSQRFLYVSGNMRIAFFSARILNGIPFLTSSSLIAITSSMSFYLMTSVASFVMSSNSSLGKNVGRTGSFITGISSIGAGASPLTG